MIKRRLIKALLNGNIKGHFSQFGEDIVIHKLFPRNKTDGTYIDIGAYHPFRFSNTAYLWMKGWSGINVDANQHSITHFDKIRPADINIFGAVVSADTAKTTPTIPIYLSEQSSINPMGTSDASIAAERNLSSKIDVPTIAVNDIFSRATGAIDFVSIDVEGLDEVVLNEIDFDSYRPQVICIEDYGDDLADILTSGITTTLHAAGYSLNARVGPSSIFVQK